MNYMDERIHQLCTTVRGWSFVGNVLKVSSLISYIKKLDLKNMAMI